MSNQLPQKDRSQFRNSIATAESSSFLESALRACLPGLAGMGNTEATLSSWLSSSAAIEEWPREDIVTCARSFTLSRTYPSDVSNVAGVANLLEYSAYRNVHVVYADNFYGNELQTTFQVDLSVGGGGGGGCSAAAGGGPRRKCDIRLKLGGVEHLSFSRLKPAWLKLTEQHLI